MVQSQNNNLPSVFLSHSSKDNDFCKTLADRLEKSLVKVWFDENIPNAGDPLIGGISSAIYECEFFVIALSKNAVASDWVQKELETALIREIKDKGFVVIPILLEAIALPPFLEGKFRLYFNSEEIFDESFEKLRKRLFRDKTISDEKPDKFYPPNFIPDLKFFVGREELLENLKRKLDEKHRASIHDISGLGKTFTTYKFADEFQDDYQKIFFVRVSKEEMLKNLAEHGVLLNPHLKDEPDQSKQALGFKDWLEKNNDWLAIFDNVDLSEELFPFVPLNKKGDCLFTSNFPEIARLGDEITIKKLDKPDAEKLLFNRANNLSDGKIELSVEEKESFGKIIEEIDGHPLSLNTTDAFISKKVISFTEFYRKLTRTPEILLKNEDGFDNYQNKSALKAFSIALDDISQKKDDDEFENSAELTRKLLFAASFLAPDNIPEELLQRTLGKMTGIDFESEENEDLWQEIRRKLLAYDLLKFDRPSKLFRTHRLIQKVIEIRQNEDELKENLYRTIAALDELFEYSDYETKENCELYTPHAIVLSQKAEKGSLSSKELASIYVKIGIHLRETIKFKDSITYFLKAIDFYQNLPVNEQINLASCYHELGLVYDSLGKYEEAIKLYKEALLIDEKTIGKEHRDYATHLGNLTNIYFYQGKYEEAIKLYNEYLLINEKTIGKENLEYAPGLNNVAYVYYKQGKYEEAIKFYKEVLLIDEKTIGKEHPDYATHLNNLALVYNEQGKYEEALILYREALLIDEKIVGKEHPLYSRDLNNLAIVYLSQGEYEKAIELYKEALLIIEKIVGKEFPDYATQLSNLAHVYYKQGKYEEAIKFYKEVLLIDEKTIGKENYIFATHLNNLAYVYHFQGKYDEALPIYEEALRIFVKFLGENHPDTKTAKRNLEYCLILAKEK